MPKALLNLLLILSLLLGGPAPFAWASASPQGGPQNHEATSKSAASSAQDAATEHQPNAHPAHNTTSAQHAAHSNAALDSKTAGATGEHGQDGHACCEGDTASTQDSCCGKSGCRCACLIVLALPSLDLALDFAQLRAEPPAPLFLGPASQAPTPPLRPPALA